MIKALIQRWRLRRAVRWLNSEFAIHLADWNTPWAMLEREEMLRAYMVGLTRRQRLTSPRRCPQGQQ